jgi:hypothetical protein
MIKFRKNEKMARKRNLKVFGGDVFFHRGKQLRTIIAAYSQKEAAEKAGISLYEMREWWCETGNPKELEVALAEPGVLFYEVPKKKGDYGPGTGIYKKLPYDEGDFE